MTTLGIQNHRIRLTEQTQQKKRQYITLASTALGIALTAIIIIAVSVDTIKAQKDLAVQSYMHNNCELMSDHAASNNATSYWYECPKN